MAELKLDTAKSKKVVVPRWMQSSSHERSLSDRPRLPIDDLEENGTALDTVKHASSFAYKIRKRTKRRLLECENLRLLAQERGSKGLTPEDLKKILGITEEQEGD